MIENLSVNGLMNMISAYNEGMRAAGKKEVTPEEIAHIGSPAELGQYLMTRNCDTGQPGSWDDR